MNRIDYKQLAFILNIKPVEALEKILYVYSKVTGKPLPGGQESAKGYLFIPGNNKKKTKTVRNDLPESLEICHLANYLNLPTLQQSVDDIHNNYLVRSSTRRYILLDYPEHELKTKLKPQIKMPPVLASLLKPEDVEYIENEWARRYGIGMVKV